VGEYPPFGEMNTRQLRGETPVRPYLRPTPEYLISSWTEPAMGLSTQWRLNFDSFDTEDWYDPVSLKDANGTVLASWTGHHRARHTTPWAATSTSDMSVTFSADSVDCAPAPNWCATWDWNYSGVALRSAEYSRAEPGVARWFPPIRFPGQYRDEESGLHENWNRFYDPGNGRYLSPEPMLQKPYWSMLGAAEGRSTATYSYALNNPIRHTDPTGLFVPSSGSTCNNWPAASALAKLWAGCKGLTADKPPNSCQKEVTARAGCDICQFLSVSSGPTAIIRPMTNRAHTNVGGFYPDMLGEHPEPNSTALR
jgi:RHS repeat-associated protein